MVLSNAERQARFRERLKAAAKGNMLSNAMVELLSQHREMIASMQDEVRLMERLAHKGGFTMSSNRIDTTAANIARTQGRINELQQIVDKYDPEGLTK